MANLRHRDETALYQISESVGRESPPTGEDLIITNTINSLIVCLFITIFYQHIFSLDVPPTHFESSIRFLSVGWFQKQHLMFGFAHVCSLNQSTPASPSSPTKTLKSNRQTGQTTEYCWFSSEKVLISPWKEKKKYPKLILDINSYVHLSEPWFKPASFERPTSIN